MKRPVFQLFLALFLLMASLTVIVAEERARCPVCGMFVAPYADWQGTVEFDDSTRAVMDGPKCLFKYYLEIGRYNPSKSRQNVTAVRVKDYSTKEEIDALAAYYVIWGDLYGPMGHEPIPFEKETDAQKYLKEHKGRKVLRAADITLKLLWSLDNPE